MNKLAENLLQVQQRITVAAYRAGRSPEEITLIAVSKTVDVQTARQAFELGLRDFGENHVQELQHKRQAISEARWHMIGRLQTNKVKDVVGQCCLIHSMDRWNLAEAINKRADTLDIVMPVLLEVNVSGEDQKAGVAPGEVREFLRSAEQLPNIKINGFMTMAPISAEPEHSRPVFRELKNLLNELGKENIPNVELKYLSMGMSQDFEIAVEEGANMVRVGSAIFAAEG